MRVIVTTAFAYLCRGMRAKCAIPPAFAYGEEGFLPVVPKNATIIYNMEMIGWGVSLAISFIN